MSKSGLASRRTELIIVLGALTAFAPLAIDMYLPAFPTLAQVFVTDTGHVQTTLAAFFLAFALGQAFWGPLADRYGRRRPLMVGLVLFMAASIACTMAPSITALAMLRFVQGLAACASVVIARAVVRDVFPASEAIPIFAALMLVTGLAPILAPLLGGQLLVTVGWESVFWFLAIFAGGCLLAVILRLPESLAPSMHRSLAPGAVLATYVGLIRDRRFLMPSLAGGCAIAGMFAYIAGAPFVLIEMYGIPERHFGWVFGANAMGFVIVAQINARIARKVDPARMIRTAGLVQILACLVLLTVAWSGTHSLVLTLAPLFVCIASLGLLMPNTSAIAMASFPDRAGAASALLGTMQFSLAAIASGLVGILHDGTARPMATAITLGAMFGMLAGRKVDASVLKRR
ncbi:MAG TPA: Bcr/CflA family multidrug efflux MFS transporter [Geminicoccus sp.]|jgi:DHA1 family bicyclomycin/chloramphenicol resistance-like MFS transporter|uniref:Bcr/CflA family multidrug efflux MFS transporter n=1 Tax=Geminicoccus sp. TaxID=2024832 RepID=UPI002E309989|nr:Bcr/CflA family multidrug efflux MFS transporter [Geminicoccus sp.]HEX2527400.1 Bcr/CflA family multidrug efflux MFS transporter [Geminicoccus sp.]